MDKCPTCGEKTKSAGPLWKGNVAYKTLVAAAAKEAEARGLAGASKVIGGLMGVDRFPSWSFSLEEISSSLGVPSVSRKSVSEHLEAQGYVCGSQPFEKEGLKTDASFDEVLAAARKSAGLPQA